MADKTIYIDFITGKRITADGSSDSSRIKLYYNTKPNWEIIFNTVSSGVLTPVNLSNATTWRAAVDDDFNHASTPWVRVLDADIDDSNKATGKIVVPVDAFTSEFETGIGTSESKKVYFELAGLNASGEEIYYVRFAISAENEIDPAGGTPPGAPGNYYTKTEIDAICLKLDDDTQISLTDNSQNNIILADITDYRAVIMEYTIDDGTNYHAGRLIVFHDGTNGEISGHSYDFIPAEITTITYAADISGGYLRLNVTLASVGSSLDMFYRITGYLGVST